MTGDHEKLEGKNRGALGATQPIQSQRLLRESQRLGQSEAPESGQGAVLFIPLGGYFSDSYFVENFGYTKVQSIKSEK